MKRATVTLPDDLEIELAAYLQRQEAPPSLTAVVQAALREYLENRKWTERQYRPPKGPLAIPVAGKGSGKTDVSVNHDKHFAAG